MLPETQEYTIYFILISHISDSTNTKPQNSSEQQKRKQVQQPQPQPPPTTTIRSSRNPTHNNHQSYNKQKSIGYEANKHKQKKINK